MIHALLIWLLLFDQPAEDALKTGTALTGQGEFEQALPYFLASRGKVREAFALEFNLALCYVGLRRFPEAILLLNAIPATMHPADVNSLLAQAFIGDRQPALGEQAFRRAVATAPDQERIYLLVAEACQDEEFFSLGVQVAQAGLERLPGSAKLLFERGFLRSRLEEYDLASQDFELVSKAAPGTQLAYLAKAQAAFMKGDVQTVVSVAQEADRNGKVNYLLLTMLGEALLRAGATPSTPQQFGEAQAALQRAIGERANYAEAHIALGKSYLLQNRINEAIEQLETGRALAPQNRTVYGPLATALRRSGQIQRAEEMLRTLAELNRRDVARIGLEDGGHLGYAGTPSVQ